MAGALLRQKRQTRRYEGWFAIKTPSNRKVVVKLTHVGTRAPSNSKWAQLIIRGRGTFYSQKRTSEGVLAGKRLSDSQQSDIRRRFRHEYSHNRSKVVHLGMAQVSAPQAEMRHGKIKYKTKKKTYIFNPGSITTKTKRKSVPKKIKHG